MYHNDKLSIFFEDGQVNDEVAPALDEYPLPGGDAETENTTRIIFSIKPRTLLRIVLKLHEGFNLFDTDGLRVTMAIGREYYSPDDVQSWWIPYEQLLREEDAVIGWESFWVWNSETASQGTRKITAPPPPGKQDDIALSLAGLLIHYLEGDFKSTPCNEWADIMQAAPGCIAVYVTRGTLPRKPVRGSKRCKTDPPESRV
jgi:hypothetical protein